MSLLEAASGLAVRYLKEDPWERIRLMCGAIVKTPLSSFLRSKNLVTFDFVPDDKYSCRVYRALQLRELIKYFGKHFKIIAVNFTFA